MNCNQNFKISQVTEGTLVLGIDVGSNTHYARAFDWSGLELSKDLSLKILLKDFKVLFCGLMIYAVNIIRVK